ncbi:hypothetical protein HY440_02960 [Candidatus Microgenomates bacterium]|nr:hypothetical protein [Candidatus Microgenomates bacterium]
MSSRETVYEVGNRRVHAIAEITRKATSAFTALGVALIGMVHVTNFAPTYQEAVAWSVYSTVSGIVTYVVVHDLVNRG